jgi:hypothetical protein
MLGNVVKSTSAVLIHIGSLKIDRIILLRQHDKQRADPEEVKELMAVPDRPTIKVDDVTGRRLYIPNAKPSLVSLRLSGERRKPS